jgi:hypothetical protein
MTRVAIDRWRLSIGSVKAGVGPLAMALGEIHFVQSLESIPCGQKFVYTSIFGRSSVSGLSPGRRDIHKLMELVNSVLAEDLKSTSSFFYSAANNRATKYRRTKKRSRLRALCMSCQADKGA